MTTYRYLQARLGDQFILQCKAAGDEYFKPIYQGGGYSVLVVDTEAEAKRYLEELSNH